MQRPEAFLEGEEMEKKEWRDDEAIRTDANDPRTLIEAARGDDLIHLANGQPIICTRDKKNRRVVPDEVMNEHYKELPDGTRAQDGRIAQFGGILKPLGTGTADDEADIQRKGGEALQAKLKQRLSFAESIDILLRSKAGNDEKIKYGLPDNATKQDALLAAMYAEAINKGTVRAADFLRDTVGEKPIDRQQVEADITTEADRILIAKIRKRLEEM